MYVLKYLELYFTFFLRQKTAIQKGIATVLCIYIDYIHILNIMNASTDKAFNLVTAPIRFFFCSRTGFVIKNISFHIYRASRIIAV